MPGDYDVDARLAQGRAAVDDIGEYVRACQQLGYHHPDLTVPPAQAYSGEDGLRLDALAADAASLTAMATAADDAVRRQSELLATLPGAWSGRGAGVALDFLTRHQRAAVTVSAALREAADAITALRDELWRAVDAKVSATLAVDGRQQGQRAAWLAAARTVATGAGDLASASELVDQQVKPFVDNDVRVDWLAAMRAGSATVDAAYDAAIARIRGAPDAVFEVPGGLGPQWTAPVERATQSVEGGGAVREASVAGGPATVAPAAVAPAALAAPPVPGPPLAPSAPLASEPLPTAAPPQPSLPGSPFGELGGTPSLGTGLSGFGQQLSDLLGGLTGAAGDASPELDPPDLTDDDPDDPDVDSDEDEQNDDEDDDQPDAEEEPTDPTAAAPEAPIEPEPPPEPAPEPTPTPVPPPVPEPPPAQDVAAEPPGQTPCEIAADELPQVGE